MRSPEETRYHRQMFLAALAALALAARGVWDLRIGAESGPALLLVAGVILLAIWMRWRLRPR